ncbi:MAG: hypothetical protein SVU94_12775 [Bacteroidota bacterium]|nr:hypothetical protein [Bacteroidota bacterium]
MRILFILLAVVSFSVNLFAQNLVPNPSFEVYDECPYDMTIYPQKKLIPHWYMPNRGTSDYFNSCTNLQVSVPTNFIGNLWAYDGHAYAGIVLLEMHVEDTAGKKDQNYREYLQTEIKRPLLKNHYYLVKLHYAVATYSTYAVNRLGIYFSKEQIKNRRTYQTLEYDPQVVIPEDTILTETNIWYTLYDTIKASGGEKYITIGNFYLDKKTDFAKLDISQFNLPLQDHINNNGLAYYYIDMVSVEELVRKDTEKCTPHIPVR